MWEFLADGIGGVVAGCIFGAIGMKMYIAKKGATKGNTKPPKK